MGKKRKPGWAKDQSGEPASKKAKNDHPKANGLSAAVSSPPPAAVDAKPKREHKAGPRPGRPEVNDDRRREAVLYDLLRSEDPKDRIAAADELVTKLVANGGAPEDELERHLEKKLFPGLASGSKGSRLGYSLVITEIVRQLAGEDAARKYERLTPDHVLSLLKVATTPRGNLSGQAERDAYFGRLFGVECFVKAGVLFAKPEETSSWRTVLDMLMELADKKSWLRSPSAFIVVREVKTMGRTHVETTLKAIADGGWTKTPEGVAVEVAAADRLAELKVKPASNPLAAGKMPQLAALLTDTFSEENDGASLTKAGQVNGMGQLHCVWTVILDHYASNPKRAEEFPNFWLKAVEERLFSRNVGNFQKYRGFLLFSLFLQGFAPREHATKLVKSLFSKHFMTSLMNHAAETDRYLHKMAFRNLATINAVGEAQPYIVFPMLSCLLGSNGCFNFDQRTKAQTVAKLLHHVGKDADKVTKLLKDGVLAAVQDDSANAARYLRVYAEYLFNLTCAGSAHVGTAERKAVDWAFAELISLACFTPSWIPEASLTDAIRSFCRDQLQKAVTRLIRVGDVEYLCQTVLAIDSSAVEMDDEIVATRELALECMKLYVKAGFGRDHSTSAKVKQALALLYAVALVLLYEEEPDAVNILEDLGGINVSDADSSIGLVGVLLAMVALQSSMARQAAQHVFEAFAGQMSSEALKLLTDVLEAGENAEGHRALFNTESDEEMDDGPSGTSDDSSDESAEDDSSTSSDSGSDSELDSDVEILDADGINTELVEDDDGDNAEDSESEEEDEELAKLDNALATVLRSHRLDKDREAESSDSDSDMTDSEMMALDGKLAEVFKQRAKSKPDGKKQVKEQKERVIYFKQRALELLTIYVKKEPLSLQTLELLRPLLTLIRTTTDRPLATRTSELLKTMREEQKKARVRRLAVPAGEVEDESVTATSGELSGETGLALLRAIHEEAAKDTTQAFTKAASAASLTLAANLCALEPANIRAVADVYAATTASMVLEGKRVGEAFFTEWAHWCQSLAQKKSGNA